MGLRSLSYCIANVFSPESRWSPELSKANCRTAYVVAFLLAALLLVWSCIFRSHPSAAVYFQNKHFYFPAGDIPEGQFVSHEFQITNHDATRSVIVCGIETGCSCTTVNMGKEELSPKESTVVALCLNTSGRQNDTQGLATILWRYLNESEIHRLTLGLIANVVNILIANPPGVDFGAIQDVSVGRSATVIFSRGDLREPWDSIVVTHANSNLEVNVVKRDSSTYELRIYVDPSKFPIGPFRDDLTVSCYEGRDRLSRSLTVPVSGSVDSNIEATPKSLFFGVVAQGHLLKQTFKITSDQFLQFISADSSRSNCLAISPEINKGYSLSFQCTFNSKGMHGNQGGKCLVTLSEGGNIRTVVVPFIVYVQ